MKNWRLWTQITAIYLGSKKYHWFSRKTPIFSPKIGENIAETSVHNIDPYVLVFCQLSQAEKDT
jgi:hypothetical protein